MAKKFIQGTFKLQENVTDVVTFENERMPQLMNIINWAKKNDVGLNIGTSENNTYLCEFVVHAQTEQMCKGYVSELKAMWKKLFPKAKIIMQITGNILR